MLTVSRLNLVSTLNGSSLPNSATSTAPAAASSSSSTAGAPSCFKMHSSADCYYNAGDCLGSNGGVVDFDTTGGLNASTGLFTAPVAGYYQVMWRVSVPQDTRYGYFPLQAAVNGYLTPATIVTADDLNAANSAAVVVRTDRTEGKASSTIFKVNAGDTIGVYVPKYWSALSLTSHITWYQFSGSMLK